MLIGWSDPPSYVVLWIRCRRYAIPPSCAQGRSEWPVRHLLGGESHQVCPYTIPASWMTIVYVPYASSFLISVRCIYRIVEFFEGVTGTIYRTEAYFHVSYIFLHLCMDLTNPLQVFEAALMYLNILIFNLFHPGRFLPKSNRFYLDANGQEVESANDRGGWDDNRPWYTTLFDPFNVQGLIHRYKERRAAKQHAAEGTQKV